MKITIEIGPNRFTKRVGKGMKKVRPWAKKKRERINNFRKVQQSRVICAYRNSRFARTASE